MQRNHPKRTAILRGLSQFWSAACWLGLIALLVIVFLFFWSNHRSSLPASNSNEDAVFMQTPPNIKRLAVTNQTANGTVYTINNATAVFDADVEPALDRVYTNVASAITAAKDLGREVLPSVDVIHAQCKAFNDDLTWAMEQWLQSGRKPMNKQQALQRLLSSVSEPRAHLILATARHLGGAAPSMRFGQEALIQSRAAAFRSAERTPPGAWNESEERRRIFLQDRYLMAALPDGQLIGSARQAVLDAIRSDPELETFFRFLDQLDAKRINPASAHRGGHKGTYTAFADRAAATNVPEIALQLVARRDTPEARLFALVEFTTMESFATNLEAAINQGKISLAPTDASGFYDYQIHALETLLIPERARESLKLRYTPSYREHLRESFKAAFTADRETQVKYVYMFTTSLSAPAAKKPEPITLRPGFSVEPTLTVYLRLAQAYRFLHQALSTCEGLDPALLNGTALQADRLAGLCLQLRTELGIEIDTPADQADRSRALQAAKDWLASWPTEPAFTRDVRTAIPFVDNRMIGIAGIVLTPAIIQIVRPPSPCSNSSSSTARMLYHAAWRNC